jgi:hypothetical protein
MKQRPETAEELFTSFAARYKFVESTPTASTAWYLAKADRVALDRADSWPIVLEARRCGRQIDDIWWFVNTPERYPECVPMLVRHLDEPHRIMTMDALVRALTVDYARGIATQPLLRLLRREFEQPLPHPEAFSPGAIQMHRAAIAASLAMNADRSIVPEVEELLKDLRYEWVKSELKRALRIGKKH